MKKKLFRFRNHIPASCGNSPSSNLIATTKMNSPSQTRQAASYEEQKISPSRVFNYREIMIQNLGPKWTLTMPKHILNSYFNLYLQTVRILSRILSILFAICIYHFPLLRVSPKSGLNKTFCWSPWFFCSSNFFNLAKRMQYFLKFKKFL